MDSEKGIRRKSTRAAEAAALKKKKDSKMESQMQKIRVRKAPKVKRKKSDK